LKLKKAESEPAYCWRPVEVESMVQFCGENKKLEWLKGVIIGLACTGLRISEFAGLRWSDIDLSSGCILLTDESGHRQRVGRQRRQIKSSRSRSFPIHPNLEKVIQQLNRIDGNLFHGPRGGRLKPDTVRNVLVRDVITPLTDRFPTADDEKGFRDGRLHSFRHYFCSTCANSGVPERMVMHWLGHADSAMVRHYYHLHDELARHEMNKVNFLGSAGGRSTSNDEGQPDEGVVESSIPESRDSRASV